MTDYAAVSYERGVKARTAIVTPLRKFSSTSKMAKRNDFEVAMKGVIDDAENQLDAIVRAA